jgi:hypothetical protein
MDKAPDNKALAGSDIPFPFESEFASRLTMGDIAYYDLGARKTDIELGVDDKGKQIKFDHLNPSHYNRVPKLNKLGKIPNKTSWDSFAYSLMMGHNVECHIKAVQRAQQLMDIECTRFKPDWRSWGLEGKKEVELSDWVPRRVLYFSGFVEELFNTKTKAEAFNLIDMATPFLKKLEGARLQGGPVAYANPGLIEFGDGKTQEDIDFANPEDTELRNLEESLDN